MNEVYFIKMKFFLTLQIKNYLSEKTSINYLQNKMLNHQKLKKLVIFQHCPLFTIVMSPKNKKQNSNP